ncbi:RDD family protein [Tenacibaculum agarivorans]|uniref:RDD family protein n=1 Tax=Tenacibaculum agarivorans TaxID=1908389 RepID=UPI00094B9724|nr:RDD family protein [Tenacibaculum agarivorans]
MDNKFFQFAGFWKRFLASIIDNVLIIFFSGSMKWYIFDTLSFTEYNQDADKTAHIIWIFYLFFVRWSYFSGMESSPLKATIGKIAVGIYVTDKNGNRINLSKANKRFFLKIVSGLTFSIGYIMAGYPEKKQALHDMLSDCLVLEK